MTTDNGIAALLDYSYWCLSLICALFTFNMSFVNRRKPRKIGGDDEENDEGGGQGWLIDLEINRNI